MQTSSINEKMKPSTTLAMNEMVQKKRKKGEQIFHMGFGESPFPVHPLIRKSLSESAHQRVYLPTQGILPLREQISRFYERTFGLKYSPEQILVAPGSKVLLFNAQMSLKGPLFLPTPAWVSYDEHAHIIGKRVFYMRTSYSNGYRLTPEVLEKAVEEYPTYRGKQKILLMNYPCNPTGITYTESQLKEIATVARDNDFVVLSDEIYAPLTYEGVKHHSFAKFYPESTLVTGGLSKDHSAGGYRLGVMLLPEAEKDLKSTMLAIGSNTWSCVAAPIQYAAIEAYSENPEIDQYRRDCTSIHELVTKEIHRRIISQGIACHPPQGAFYLFPNWNDYRAGLKRQGIHTSSDLTSELLNTWNVACLPGSDFAMPRTDLGARLATVDYDGEAALQRFKSDTTWALKNPIAFVEKVAPRLVSACEQLGEFTSSLG